MNYKFNNKVLHNLYNELCKNFKNVDIKIDNSYVGIDFDVSINGYKVWVMINSNTVKQLNTVNQLCSILPLRNSYAPDSDIDIDKIYSIISNLLLKEKIENVIKL